jgi:hypothetical protein
MTNSEREKPRWQMIGLFIFPFLHICVCVATAFSRPVVDLEPLTMIDAPFSFFIIALMGWNTHHPLIWFGILGSVWWYLLAVFFDLEIRKAGAFFRKH